MHSGTQSDVDNALTRARGPFLLIGSAGTCHGRPTSARRSVRSTGHLIRPDGVERKGSMAAVIDYLPVKSVHIALTEPAAAAAADPSSR